jgi:hypothetical protein
MQFDNTLKVGEYVFTQSEGIWRIDEIEPRFLTANLVRSGLKGVVGEPLNPLFHLSHVYDSNLRRIQVQRKSRVKVVDASYCRRVTTDEIDKKIADLKRQMLMWECLKGDVGISKGS